MNKRFNSLTKYISSIFAEKSIFKNANILPKYTVELQWLEHPCDYENLFESGVVRVIEG